MAINFKKLVAALGEVESDTKISEEVIFLPCTVT